MRVAITVLVALTALAGPIPALAACSSGSTGGGSSKIVNPVLELVGLPPLGSSTTTSPTTTITNTTTTITNNVFTTAAPDGPDQSATTAQPATPIASAGGGSGGGGGIGGLGGGVSGGSSAGGSPINPSSESSAQMVAGGGTSSGGGSSVSVSDPIILASLSATTPSGSVGSLVMPSPDPSSDLPVTPSIARATLRAPTGGTDDLMTVAMASPTTAPPAGGDGFGLERQPSGAGPRAPGDAGTTMLAALIGVGMLGAGWAWRSL